MKRRITGILLVMILFAACIPVQDAEAITTTVRVGFCSQMPPLQYVDEEEQPLGLHIDVLEYIAKEEDLILEYQAFYSTVDALEAMQEGTVDIVLGVVDEHFTEYNFLYSNSVSTTNLCLTAPTALSHKYERGKSGYFRLGSEYRILDFTFLSTLTRSSIMIEPNQIATVEELVYGQAEMIVGVKECLMWYFEEHEIQDDYVILNNYLASADFTIAVREGDWHLFESINGRLVDLRASGEYEDLYNSWISKDKSIDYQKLLRIVLYIAAFVLVFLGAYLIVSYRAKRQLTELVAVRTCELHETNQKLERRTAQVEAENRLRYSIIEASPAGMILVDENLNLEYMNQSALQIAGIQDFQIGDSICSLRILREIMRDVGSEIFEEEWDYKSGTQQFYKDKSRNIWEKYRYSIHKMTLYEGKKGALITLENVTAEEKEREAIFEKDKNETLNTLIAGIAHEIKNPLTAISASADMIQSKGDNEKFRKAFSAYVPQEIERITRLINSLIDYARPSGRRIELLSVQEILPSVVELAKVTARNTDFNVILCQSESLKCTGDKDKIKQSLLNIVINSIEATRQKKTEPGVKHQITVESYREEDMILIRITDDGIGMSANELRRCMNPFYTTKPVGTGIGLALTKQYIEEVGGSIVITSEKDCYTCVEIRLPAAEEKEELK